MKHLSLVLSLVLSLSLAATARRRLTNSVPDCTNGSTMWCDPRNYPDNKVTEMLSRNGTINQFLDKDKVFKGFLITPHVQFLPYYENVCEERTDYIYPKAAKNEKGDFMFIVNNPGGSDKHRQLVKVTRCSMPDEDCGQGDVFRGSTSCVQEYSDHKLVALSKSGEELVVDTFSFPSCCICKVYQGEL